MSNSLVTHQPCLSTCSETLPMASYIQIELTAQLFPLNFRIEVYSLLFSGECFFSIPLSHRYVSITELPHLFPSSTSLRGSKSQFVVKPRSLTDGYPAPYPH
jgi:hypothetical protein